jgi:flagellar protein FliO/FliZ
MSIYLNAGLMLFATLATFVGLAVAVRFARNGGFGSVQTLLARRGALANLRPQPRRLRIEEVRQLDSKRRLVLVACDGQDLLLLTGGPADLVIRCGAFDGSDARILGAAA